MSERELRDEIQKNPPSEKSNCFDISLLKGSGHLLPDNKDVSNSLEKAQVASVSDLGGFSGTGFWKSNSSDSLRKEASALSKTQAFRPELLTRSV